MSLLKYGMVGFIYIGSGYSLNHDIKVTTRCYTPIEAPTRLSMLLRCFQFGYNLKLVLSAMFSRAYYLDAGFDVSLPLG